MNIRDIEARLGIPRASVRYYEKEGLLHPRRGSNNYRDYSQEDLETLQKIRLLRELDMPVETIRAVQAGEVPLSGALERQAALLESESSRLDHARAVCRAMAEEKGQELLERVRGLRVEGIETQVTVSVGAASAPALGRTYETLSLAADEAMYQVKHSGKGGFILR